MVDALVSGTSVSNDVQVRVLFWALRDTSLGRNNQIFERTSNVLTVGEVAELVDALL